MMVELDGTLKQALWNARAAELGLGPLAVETRYGAGAVDAEAGSLRKEVVLTWEGGEIPNMELVEQSLLHHEDQWIRSWGVDSSKVNKETLLDVIERVFPGGQPEPQPDGFYSAVDQSKVLQALRER
jgi:hypothetical protein